MASRRIKATAAGTAIVLASGAGIVSFASAQTNSSPTSFVSMVPCRLIDTRVANDAVVGPHFRLQEENEQAAECRESKKQQDQSDTALQLGAVASVDAPNVAEYHDTDTNQEHNQ